MAQVTSTVPASGTFKLQVAFTGAQVMLRCRYFPLQQEKAPEC